MVGSWPSSASQRRYDVFLLDEFTYLLHFGWLDAAEVITGSRPTSRPCCTSLSPAVTPPGR